ncbi:TIGR04211 family SH3 domain-containing protein [Glaesserella parasuis]|uniref:SH3 domain-containing protein n=1 Tax=Glaesserella parasuis serovar 5 (strain SH0165) TaxID=557723 RepID=B8F4T2_GLAP5|nr:TIGR04211 family SH3 domain-containing protein [Glaesserella parasuis]ACL32334.1 SH3 domain-containing protein [Glaesserella parasuis SH0165]MDG6867592.1 TIGR04211 family SH3 domain-containing protein [Glaesserella parasuis]MDO9921803.1 TIGR04211 family SH3 domain-containing protein [Glaesserella parasuis]MDP0059714.1 TIGR04211 family SH3 domain-containing protein [Glaesserella parasuis]MDP0061839.1 TIGR04211 family SH3 domain-containing protein [Glaesserella parasuis]
MQKHISLFCSTLLLAISIPSFAQTQYVTENLNTYLRKGPGDQFKISGSIQAGEKVTLIETRDRYSLIRDGKNREAWILNSELTSTPSSKELTPLLQQQVRELTTKLNNIDRDWQQRTAEMQRRVQQSALQSSELLEQNALLKRELEIIKNKNRDLEAIQDVASREIMIQYFIYGGAVLGLGLIFGLLIPALLPRRKSNYRWN